MLLNSGDEFALKFFELQNIKAASNQITEELIKPTAKTYDVLFEYLCSKLTTAKITRVSLVTGQHIGGWYTGTTNGSVTVKIT